MKLAVAGPLLLLGTAAWTCIEGPGRSQMQGPSDGGVTQSRPARTVFAMGIWDNSAGAPQGASLVNLYFDEGTRDLESVVASRRSQAPLIDGEASDWQDVEGGLIGLSPRGTASGMSEELWNQEYILANGSAPLFDFGIYDAQVKASYDDENLYFLIQWKDATQDNRRDEWLFDGTTWTRNRTFNEDRLSLAFNIDGTTRGFDEIGCAAACHIKTHLGDVSTTWRSYRFRMHTRRAGELADFWVWRASTSDPMGYADDGYWDETGRKGDGPNDWAVSNSKTSDAGTFPVFMSEEGINANPSTLFAQGAGSPRAVPFDGTGADAGARLPGFVMQWASPNRDGVRAAGKWSNGQWTVELARSRDSADPKDARFLPSP